MGRREADAVLAAAVALGLLIAVTGLPTLGPLRIVLATLFLLFLPGYSLTAALFPRHDQMDTVERLALSLGLSVAIVPLIALALNYSSWGIRLHPLLAFVALFIGLAMATAVVRRRLLPEREAFGLTPPSASFRRPGEGVLAATAALALIAFAAAAYVVGPTRGGEEAYTEFYLAQPGAQRLAGPTPVGPGAGLGVTLVVTNHEGRDTRYRIVARMNGAAAEAAGYFRLADGERWRDTVTVTPTRAGDGQRVEFLLYREGVSETYRSLSLELDVERPPDSAFVSEESTLGARSGAASPEPPAANDVLAEQQQPEEEPPAPEPQQPPPPPPVHVVAPGENLTEIAGLYGVPLAQVIAANELDDPDLIYPQQEILIPAASGEGGEQAP